VTVDAFGLAWLPRWHVTADDNGQSRQIDLDAYEFSALMNRVTE